MSRRFIYNQWDYGYRGQPIRVGADFGARGHQFGIGVQPNMGILDTDQDIQSGVQQQHIRDEAEAAEAEYDRQMQIRREAEAAEAQADAAAAARKIVELSTQLDQVQSQMAQATGNVAASLQQQISDLTAQLTMQQSTAAAAQAKADSLSSGLASMKKYLPYVAVGLGALLLIGMIASKPRHA